MEELYKLIEKKLTGTKYFDAVVLQGTIWHIDQDAGNYSEDDIGYIRKMQYTLNGEDIVIEYFVSNIENHDEDELFLSITSVKKVERNLPKNDVISTINDNINQLYHLRKLIDMDITLSEQAKFEKKRNLMFQIEALADLEKQIKGY